MGLFKPAEAGRAPGSKGLAELIICLAAFASLVPAAACDSCTETLGTGPATGGVENVAFRRAEPGRPDDVPGLAVLPSGVCGRPAAAMISSLAQVGTAGFESVVCGAQLLLVKVGE